MALLLYRLEIPEVALYPSTAGFASRLVEPHAGTAAREF